jgi:hypothetical protein
VIDGDEFEGHVKMIAVIISAATDPLELQDSVGARARALSWGGHDGGLSISGYIGPALCLSSQSQLIDFICYMHTQDLCARPTLFLLLTVRHGPGSKEKKILTENLVFSDLAGVRL